MKKLFFFFAMLAGITVNAQSTVQITPISATYTSSPTIQFKVSWTSQTATNHRNKVWVFVDFQPVVSPTQKGSWQPATITGTTQRTHGTISEQSNRGFFLEGATTNFASTVTVTLTNINTTQFNWCAYATDFPPNAIETAGTYALKGSPPFVITTTTGTAEISAKTYTGGTITALTDATGCPGVLCGKNGEAPGLLNCCTYGTTNCSGNCITNGTYTTNDGVCTRPCSQAYVQQRDQCGDIINPQYSTFKNYDCVSTCTICKNGQCASPAVPSASACQSYCTHREMIIYQTCLGTWDWVDGQCFCCRKNP